MNRVVFAIVSTATTTTEAPQLATTTPRLLVVDDNEHNREMLSRRLVKAGYDVDTADDGYQALDNIPDGNFDLILLDVVMPGISGLEVLKKLRETYTLAELPVIITTVKDSSGDMVEGLELGANDYVFKPINFPVLLARVRTHLDVKQLHEERKKLLETQQEFLAIAGHDLRNPLSVVIGLTELLLMKLQPDSQISEHDLENLSLILQAGHDMNELIYQFINMHALQEGQLHLNVADLDLGHLMRSVVDSYKKRALDKEIDLRVETSDITGTCTADEQRIRQVVLNLVGNAIKFCGPGDHITVRLSEKDGYAVMEVVDSGPGLTETDLSNCFQKQTRLSNKPTGGETSTGNGLYIARKLVQAHGGDVTVHNNADGGATFSFRIGISPQP